MQKSERSARADKASPAPASAPAPAMRPAPEHPPPLKRMEFVRSYGSTAYETATGLASSALSSAPTPLSNAANSAYAAVAPRVEPFAMSAYSVVAPRATFLLESVDTRVDGMMVTAEKLYAAANARAEKMVETKKAMHADGMERYAAAKELYLTKVEEILEVLKSQGIKGTAHDAAELVATKVAELRQVPAAVSKDVKNRLHDKFVQLQAAWDKLSSHPEVAKVVNLYSASISTLQAKVAEAHDTLVTNPRYGAALDQAGHYLNMVQGTTVYSRLHAAFAPYAGPYAERLYTSSYVTAAMDYMKPAPALEGIKTK